LNIYEQPVAILGGRGMLGRDLCPVLQGAGWSPVVFDVPEFDLCAEEQVRAVAEKYSVIVNCAAYTNVEKAEAEPETAFAVNGAAVGMLGRMAAEHGCHVLHISTDFVFDGEKDGAYSEEDEPNPVSVYGASKLAGERLLVESGCDHCIVRVQWTYGGGSANNFVEKIRRRAESGEPLRVVDDQRGSPTWTLDVSRALVELLGKRIKGLFHYASAGMATRFEVARKILEICGYDVVAEACSTSDFPSAARRPANSVFDCGRIDGVLTGGRREWGEALLEYLSG
jgi:dTDP-4-dehydrorhamnose reductase